MRNLAHTHRDQIIDWLGDTELKAKPQSGYRRQHTERDWLAEFGDEPEPAPKEVARVTPDPPAPPVAIADAAPRILAMQDARLRTMPRRVAIAVPMVLALALAVGVVAKNTLSRPADAPGPVLQAALPAEAQPIATAPTAAQPPEAQSGEGQPAEDQPAEGQPAATSPSTPPVAPAAPALRTTPPPNRLQPLRSTASKGAAAIVAPVRPDKKRGATPEKPAASLKATPPATSPVRSESNAPVPRALPAQNVPTTLAGVLKEPARPAATIVAPPPAPPPPAGDRLVEAPVSRATPAPSAREIETGAVQSVLERYRAAFNSLSVSGVQSFWPDANTRTLSRAFEQLQSQQLDFESCGIDVYLLTGSATARCKGQATFVPRVGGRSERIEQRAWSFKLSRVQDRWIIVSVESR